MGIQNFDHSHHKLKIRGLKSPVDVLTFTGHEQLSSPFRYDIQFTSSDKAIAPESVLMQDGAFSLTARTGNAGTDCPAHPARRHYRL